MQKENSVIKNYILSSEKVIIKDNKILLQKKVNLQDKLVNIPIAALSGKRIKY